MSAIAVWLSTAGLTLAVAAGLLGPLPTTKGVQDLSGSGLSATSSLQSDRLQGAWAREQAVYARLGRMFDKSDQALARAQDLVDRAKQSGKDVSAVQAALNDLSDAIQQARPVCEGGKGIVAAHKGFDANGIVVDVTQARETVLDMQAKLMEIRGIVSGPWRALWAAVKAFRQTNIPQGTPTPTAAGA